MNLLKCFSSLLLGFLCLLYPSEVCAEFSIITYNIHGGYGPDGEGDPESNLIAFRDNFMNDEDVLCFQEVDFDDGEWEIIQDVFSDYPYTFQTINQETDYYWWETRKETSIAILSKYPLLSTDSELIQIDPQYDKWQRHAQHVTIQQGEEVVDIFHFHNTYNFNDNDWEYEKSGLTAFRDYVYDELGISSLDEAENLVMLGDFNLIYTNVVAILDTPARKSDGRDHICSIPYFSASGKYATVSADLSDHPALWAKIDVQAPVPNPMEWVSVPVANGFSAIAMEATAASDVYDVEYYFSNTTIADGSHDSGWQSSPVYVDTGLTEGISYSYTVMARDKSVNVNTTEPSASASAVAVLEYLVPPYEESFESGFGDWSQSVDDDLDWTRYGGYTPTANTGPSNASDGDWYLYVENHDASGTYYKTASIFACFDFSAFANPSLSFDYHMYGPYIDYLSLDVHDGTGWTSNVWTKSGQQQTSSEAAWAMATVDLSAYAGFDKLKLRFRSKQLKWHAADTAIDNVKISGNEIPVATSFDLAVDVDTATSITLSGSDPEGSNLIFVVVSQPINGTLFGTSPNLTYTPNSGYVGMDSFTYMVNDGVSDSEEATVSISIADNPPGLRVTEYYLTTGDFSGTSATLTLDQALADDYFILVRGSRDGNALSMPDNDYARVTAVPAGTGDMADTGVATAIELTRAVADADWEGVVTVVECTNPTSSDGFKLLDILSTSLSGSAGTDACASWSDVDQVVLFGGYRGGGISYAATPTGRSEGTSAYARLYPSGTGTLNWTRDAGGETLYDAVMTTFVVEWGSAWNVQRVNVAGAAGGAGADATGEYTTAAISSVNRDNTWVWGTGTRSDAGIGDSAEACLVTLGDGVSQNATESTVAVGSEYTDAYDFDVYAMTHAALAVDHRFKADGDSDSTDLAVTVDTATSGARFGWSYNGCNGTGDYFPRPRMWARYTADGEITVSRGFSGQNFPAWVQGIDFSGLNK